MDNYRKQARRLPCSSENRTVRRADELPNLKMGREIDCRLLIVLSVSTRIPKVLVETDKKIIDC
ncbi:hypothetical protein FJZ31_19200 [Candidatus Poribacteria bacterium]|nr:hypothetical protein [Candidatus Poribacteria bacterium]